MSTNLLHTSLLLLLNLVSVDPLTQDVYWREYLPGDIPYDAVEAAPGRYIGQVFHEGFLVGTIYPHSDAAVIIFNNRQNINDNVKILCSHKQDRLYWEEVNFTKPYDHQMKDALKGGFHEKWWAVDLFIGKVQHEGEWRIGKVLEMMHSYEGLWVWNNAGKRVNFKVFHLLKYNSTREERCECECGDELAFSNRNLLESVL